VLIGETKTLNAALARMGCQRHCARSSADSDGVRRSNSPLLCNAGSARCVVVARVLAEVQSHDEEKKGRRSRDDHPSIDPLASLFRSVKAVEEDPLKPFSPERY
jgi:hypothetical protein